MTCQRMGTIDAKPCADIVGKTVDKLVRFDGRPSKYNLRVAVLVRRVMTEGPSLVKIPNSRCRIIWNRSYFWKPLIVTRSPSRSSIISTRLLLRLRWCDSAAHLTVFNSLTNLQCNIWPQQMSKIQIKAHAFLFPNLRFRLESTFYA